MAKKTKTRSVRYRDTRTGHFVSESTWKRSKAQGGTHYVRTSVALPGRAAGGEYQINVKYKPSKGSKVEVQISAQGPEKQSRGEVIAAIEHRRKTGNDLPGWKTKIVEWKKAGKSYTKGASESWTPLGFIFADSEKEVK